MNTGTLTNDANQVNVGQIWHYIKDAGYEETTGTQVEPGGFMSAENMNLNVQTLQQIGGALQQLSADGTVSEARTKLVLATLQQQLGSNFGQTTVSDNLHTDFVKEGGSFSSDQLAMMVVSTAMSMMGVPLWALMMMTTAVGEAGTDRGIRLGDVLEAGAVAYVMPQVDSNLGLNNFSGVGSNLIGADLGATLQNIGTAMVQVGEQSAVNAGIQTAIDGGSFLSAFKTNAVLDIAAISAGAIGANAPAGSLVSIGLHSVLGCASSAALGTGCAGGAIGGAVSALSANAIATAVTGGQGVTNPAQLAMITAGTTLLSGTIAAALGQNVVGAVNAAANETLNNNCAHACGQDGKDTERVTVSPTPQGTSGVHDEGGNAGASTGVATTTETVGAGALASGLAGANPSAVTNGGPTTLFHYITIRAKPA